MSNITHENYKVALNGYIGLVEVAVPQNKSGKHLDNIATLYNYGKQQQAKEERAKKVEELLELYHKLLKYIGLYNASTYCTKETLNDLEQKVKATQKQIDELENKINEMVGIEE